MAADFPRPSHGFEAPAPEPARSPWWGNDVQARPAGSNAEAPERFGLDPDTLQIPAVSVVPSDPPANVQRTPTGTVGRLLIGGAVALIVGIGLLGVAVAVLQADPSASSFSAPPQHITHPQGTFWWIEETPTPAQEVSATPSPLTFTPSATPSRTKTPPPTQIATRGAMDAVRQTPRPTLIKPTPTRTTSTPKPTTVPKSTPTPTVDLSGSTGLSAAVPAIRAIVNAVETAWPSAGPYYGVRVDTLPDHPSGHAVDIMLPEAGRHVLGQAIADHLQANAATYGVDYIIFEQRVWSVDRAAEGWRPMEDRGTPTANHMDHVHVTVD